MMGLIFITFIVVIAIAYVVTQQTTERRLLNKVYRDWKKQNPHGTLEEFKRWWYDM